jgi:hypothetical protein
MSASPTRRVVFALCGYAILVVAGALFFKAAHSAFEIGSPGRLLFCLSGPALSLFTHMSYALFFLQTLLLLPWLIMGAVLKRAKGVCAATFAITWLIIGWRMCDLF